jgi:hypothetical protein
MATDSSGPEKPSGAPVTQADLEGLRTQIQDLRGKLLVTEAARSGPVLARLSALEQKWNAEEDRFNDLAQLVSDALDSLEATAGVVPALDWTAMDEAELALSRDSLTAWVAGVLTKELAGYGAAIVKGCWPNHPEVKWELGNLQKEWERVYNAEVPPLESALTFFDRWLPGAMIRLEPLMRDCSARTGCRTVPAA